MNAPTALGHLIPDVRQRAVPTTLIDALKTRFGASCSTAMAVREQHGRDESAFVTVPPPAAVVFAESTQDVADAVRLASEYTVPVMPFGVGSSLEGHLRLLALRHLHYQRLFAPPQLAYQNRPDRQRNDEDDESKDQRADLLVPFV